MNEVERIDLIKYRLHKAWETYKEAIILFEHKSFTGSVNRLYYASYYAVTALLLSENIAVFTHNGVKSQFNLHFVKSEKMSLQMGHLFNELLDKRSTSDYNDLFDFIEEDVEIYILPVKDFITEIEAQLNLT